MIANELKYFSLKHTWKKILFNIFVSTVYSWPYFCPKKDNLSCPVFVFPRGMSNGICDPALYPKSEGSNILWILRYSSIVVVKNDIRKNDMTLFF